MNGNDVVALLLRSPMQALMGNTLLLTVTGRKTGRKISLPVSYFQEGDSLWIISSRDRTWWKNLRSGARVEMRLHGRNASGFGELILDEKVVASRLDAYLRRMPASARYLGVGMTNGVPNCDDVGRAAGERIFVKICFDEV